MKHKKMILLSSILLCSLLGNTLFSCESKESSFTASSVSSSQSSEQESSIPISSLPLSSEEMTSDELSSSSLPLSSSEEIPLPDEEEEEETYSDKMKFYDEYYMDDVITYEYSGVTFSLAMNADSTGYVVISIETEKTEIIVPDSYEDLPILALKAYKKNADGVRESVFSNNTLITSVSLPDSILYLSRGLFKGCTALKEVRIPSSLIGIGDECFSGCTALEGLNLPDTLKSIRGYAFAGSGISSLTLPDSLTNLATSAYDTGMEGHVFTNCADLTQITLSSSLFALPIDGFAGCTSLQKIIIPENITTIPASCFYQCRKLVQVTLPDTLEIIDSYAFRGCSSLPEITLNEGLMYIRSEAFALCSSLLDVNIPDSLIQIGVRAFFSTPFADVPPDSMMKAVNHFLIAVNDDMKKMTSIVLPPGVKRMADALFEGYQSLISVDLGDDLLSVPDLCFAECTALSEVTLPDTIEFIGGRSFAYTYSLTSIVFNDRLTTIGIEAFSNSGLTEINIPDSLQTMSDSFYNCQALKRIIFENGDVPNGFATSFQSCEKIEEIFIPSTNIYLSVSSLCLYSKNKDTFYSYLGNTDTISSFVFPDTVTDIHDYAFSRVSQSLDLTLPSKLESIGDSALFRVTYKKDIHLPQTVSIIGKYAFSSGDGENNTVIFDGNLNDYLSISFKGSSGLLKGRKLCFGDTLLSDLVVDGNDGIDEIGAYAFQDYQHFASLTLKNLSFISHYAFHNIRCESKYIRIDTEALGVLSFYAPGNDLVFSDRLSKVYIEFVSSYSLVNNGDRIFFEGKKEKWYSLAHAMLDRESYSIYFLSEDEPTDEGDYYHYVDDLPVIYEKDEDSE